MCGGKYRGEEVNKIDAEMDSAVATNEDVTNPRVRCLYIVDACCCTQGDLLALIRRREGSARG